MKKIISLLILPIFLFTGCTFKKSMSTYDKIIKNDTLVVGVKTDTKPFGFINEKTGKNEGYDVDVAKYIVRDLLGSEDKITFVSVTPNTRLEAVTSGNVDMVIATMSVTPQRQLLIDFSVVYYVAGQTAVVKKSSNINTFHDLKNKKVIIVIGTTAEQNIKRVVPKVKILGYKTYEEAFDALKKGKGDAFITDDTILSDFVYKNNDYKMLKGKLSIEPYAIGLKKDESQKLKQAVDAIIRRMNKDGTLKYLNRKWHMN